MSTPIAELGHAVHRVARNATEYKLIIERIDDPMKPACKDFRRWLRQDYRRVSNLIHKLKRLEEKTGRDLLMHLEIAAQLRVARKAEAELRAVQIGVRPAPEGRP